MQMKTMADLRRRLYTSLILGSIVTVLIAFSTFPFVNILLVLSVAVLAGFGVWEYAQLAIAKGMRARVRWMVGAAVAEVFALYASIVFVDFPQLPIFVLAIAMVMFFLLHFNDSSEALSEISVEFFGIAYVAVPLSLMLGVLYPAAHHGAPQEGRWWLVYLIVVTKITDVGAYFVGRLWGRHKLSSLSPKKTVEGAVAGFLCAVGMSVAFHYLSNLFFAHHFHLTLIESVWLGALIGIFGQIGDLAESLLKRDAVVKDSNNLPGLGGILDMVDSLLFTTPIVYFFIRMH
ncbi:MAG: phosphatidate cytidylyltransferase [Chlamydiota bacterium]